MTTAALALRRTVMWGGFRVWQRNRDVFLRAWMLDTGGLVVEPFFIVLAMGFGLGLYIDSIHGLPYGDFVAPGILAGYAMYHASFDQTFGAYLRLETHHIYDAILYTPLGPSDIVLGEVMWGSTRSLMTGTAVLAVAAIFGLVNSPFAVLALPAAWLVGVAFACIGMTITASVRSLGAIENYFTVVLTPMFMFSGIFFPLDDLPTGVQVFSWLMPLTPGVELIRGLFTGELSGWMALWTLELLGFSALFYLLATRLMTRRLIK